jgi:hypothetical protein
MASCITGFIYWKKIKQTVWRNFPLYLLFVSCSEIFGYYSDYNNLSVLNQYYFNYFEIPIEFLFFFWLFHQALRRASINWLPRACAVIYLLSWLADIFYVSQFHFFFYSISYTIGNLLLLILILSFLMKLTGSNAILTFRQNMFFWVSFGLLLFYLGSFPYYLLRNDIAYKHPNLNIAYTNVIDILGSLMYLMFIFSFIWGKPKLKSI